MPISPAYERRIRERWRQIEPRIIIYLKSVKNAVPPPYTFQTALTHYQETHRLAIIEALDLHIPFRAIRLYGLDDPSLSTDERTLCMQTFLAVRKKHPGRTPSLGRANSKRPEAILPGDL